MSDDAMYVIAMYVIIRGDNMLIVSACEPERDDTGKWYFDSAVVAAYGSQTPYYGFWYKLLGEHTNRQVPYRIELSFDGVETKVHVTRADR